MDCTKIRGCIADYAYDGLAQELMLEVASHLAECPDCRAEFKAQEQVIRLVGDVGDVDPPAVIWSEVIARISATPVHPSVWKQIEQGSFRSGGRWYLGFATIALTGLLLYTSTHPTHPPAGSEAHQYVRGHIIYASQDVLADRTAMNSAMVLAERAYTTEDR